MEFPYPITVGGAQFAPGRTRRCCFWISSVVPDGTRYVVDATQLPRDHNLAGDRLPDDCVLVVVSPADAQRIKREISALSFPIGPVIYAAAIIDEMCAVDPTLAEALRWKVG